MATGAMDFRLRSELPEMPRQFQHFPQMRYMGSKHRLAPWIFEILSQIEFDTALDAFAGSGCVSYLLKAMGKRVVASDFLEFSAEIANATVANNSVRLNEADLDLLLSYDCRHRRFIETTFSGIFFTPEDLRFLDRLCWNIKGLADPFKRSLAKAAALRACAKRQPRGVFTVAGDPDRYKDGRRDLKLSLREHFREHVQAYNASVFDNGRENHALKSDVFALEPEKFDLVYFDPPYVPRSDDNCYIKRYHFLEGLSCYWKDREILQDSRVKKIKKPFTPFSYRRTATEAFGTLFSKFSKSILALSYSSNGFPDLDVLLAIMRNTKGNVEVHRRDHRYHFGTHSRATRNSVEEYLIIGN